MKSKSRGLSLISLTLLLYIGMWITSSCKKDRDKCTDSTRFGRITLVPFAGSNLSIGCENFSLCPSNRLIDECMANDYRSYGEAFIAPVQSFWTVSFTITAVCDDGKQYEKTFVLPHPDVSVGLNNNGQGLAYTVRNIPIDRSVTVAFTIIEPCGRHTRVCNASMNDCTTFSYAASYMQFGDLFTNVVDNSILYFPVNIQNPTAKCGCNP